MYPTYSHSDRELLPSRVHDENDSAATSSSGPDHGIEYRLRNLRLTSVDIRDSGRRDKDARDDYGVVGYTLRATLSPQKVFSSSPVIYNGSVLIPGRDHPKEFELVLQNGAVSEPSEGGLTEVLYVPALEHRDFFFIPSRTQRYLKDIGMYRPEEFNTPHNSKPISHLRHRLPQWDTEEPMTIASLYPVSEYSYALDEFQIERQDGRTNFFLRRTTESPSAVSLEAKGVISSKKYQSFLAQLVIAEEIARQLYVPVYQGRKGEKHNFGKLLFELHLASTDHGRRKAEIPTSFPIKAGFKIRESVEKRLGKKLKDF